MEVPNEALQKLLCENCESYLSRGPVLLFVDGRNRCGRCVKPDETATQNVAYEELAKLMTFPCRYKANGCKETVTFESNLEHEETCGFRNYICPIFEPGQCDWSGIQNDLLKHCKERHSDSVLENPLKLNHNITSSNLVNYFMSAFSLLFLVQTKVSVTTKKIYHAVRLVGNSNSAAKYGYDIDMQNIGTKLNKTGNVLPQGCLVLQEDTSIAVGINSLLEVLGNFQNTTFTITVRAKDEENEGIAGEISVMEKQAPTENAETIIEVIEKVKCVKCQCMREPVLLVGLGWVCRICSMTKIFCRYCSYMEIDGKCQKHEIFFCPFDTLCIICKRTKHIQEHYMTYNNTNGFLLYTFSFSWACKILKIPNNNTLVLCSYWLGDSYFAIYIFLDARSNELHTYDCMVEIKHPEGGSPFKQNLDTQYDTIWDWRLRIPRNEFNSYADGDKFTMKLSVTPK